MSVKESIPNTYHVIILIDDLITTLYYFFQKYLFISINDHRT